MEFMYLMQTVYILIRRRGMRRLIWVYTVCQCFFYNTLWINELTLLGCQWQRKQTWSDDASYSVFYGSAFFFVFFLSKGYIENLI